MIEYEQLLLLYNDDFLLDVLYRNSQVVQML